MMEQANELIIAVFPCRNTYHEGREVHEGLEN
jgi:hypothetical protein